MSPPSDPRSAAARQGEGTPEPVEAFRARLQAEAMESGEKGAEAFTRSKYAIAEYWLCWEFRLQRLHDEFCKTFGVAARCPHSDFRQFIAKAKAELAATRKDDAA